MSFTNLTSSSRGPWVLGLIMALFFVIGFGALMMFVFDERLQGGDQSVESVIARQVKEIEFLKRGIAEADKALVDLPQREAAAKELAEVTREIQDQGSRISSLKQTLADADAEIVGLAAELNAYKDAYRAFVRERAKGRQIDRLETRAGKVYKNVTISEVTAVGMQIRHNEGIRRIPFEELPDELQEEFQFDADQKAAAIAREREQRMAHEAAVLAARKQADEKSQQNTDAIREKAMREIAAKELRMNSLQNEINAIEIAIRQESGKKVSRAPQLREALSLKRHQLESLQAEIVRLRKQP